MWSINIARPLCQRCLRQQRLSLSTSSRRLQRDYASSIRDLNSLQSNAATIAALRASGQLNVDAIPEMRRWLSRAGITQSIVDTPSYIHVAGTKGKGSTSAMVAAILQNYRLAFGRTPRVGLYTSPHLKTVRERIQIDGQPLSKEDWTTYFYDVWDALEKSAAKSESKSTGGPVAGAAAARRPVYFRFLTLLAFRAFYEECCDVVVLECGVGGEHDSTNVISRPAVCGVTSLGIDHVHVLGDTVDKIAWHKAGIFKPSAAAFTVPQPDPAMAVLRKRAAEWQVGSFDVVPVHPALEGVKLGLEGAFQRGNASLAIALANAWLKTQGVDENLSTHLPREFVDALEGVRWPGRCERRTIDGVEFCLDGAHTHESMRETAKWLSTLPPTAEGAETVLVFNQQSRDAKALLRTLHDRLAAASASAGGPRNTPTRAVFCTNKTFAKAGYSAELTSLNNAADAVEALDVQHELAAAWRALTCAEGDKGAEVVTSIEEAIDRAKSLAGNGGRVIVTGSLHLVGGALTVLDGDTE